jgi:hypothetical protein
MNIDAICDEILKKATNQKRFAFKVIEMTLFNSDETFWQNCDLSKKIFFNNFNFYSIISFLN